MQTAGSSAFAPASVSDGLSYRNHLSLFFRFNELSCAADAEAKGYFLEIKNYEAVLAEAAAISAIADADFTAQWKS